MTGEDNCNSLVDLRCPIALAMIVALIGRSSPASVSPRLKPRRLAKKCAK